MKRSTGPQKRIIKVARNMPPLYHKLPGEKFSYIKSKALLWLVRRPEVWEYIWNMVKQSGSIKFDPATGKWVGVDFESGDDE